LLVATTFASAELLTTASPLGQGKWSVLGAYLSDSGHQQGGLTSISLGTVGIYGGYGVTDKLDAYLQAGSATAGNLPTGVGDTTTGIGVNLKYTVMDESPSMPVSVALGCGYKVLSDATTYPAPFPSTTNSGNQVMVAVGVSKMLVPFVPYGGLAYRSTTFNGASMGEMDLTIGTAIAWSMQGAVLAEYTIQSITPNAGAAFTANQISLGVAYKI